MQALRDGWERVGDGAYVRAKPPRTLAEAVDDDRSLIFVIAVTSPEGERGWTVRLSSRDDPGVFHAGLDAAMEAGDRLLARLARVNSALIAAEAGLDPATWSFEPRHPVGRGVAFVNRREPTFCVAREVDGAAWRIMRGSVAAHRRFPDPASAAGVLMNATGHAVPPSPGPRMAELDADAAEDLGVSPAMVVDVSPVGPSVPVPAAYAADPAEPYTHVASLSVDTPSRGTIHKAPLRGGDAVRIAVGVGVGVSFGPRRADGSLPVTRILVRAPEPTYRP